MAKLKTKRAAAKRFKIKPSGKIRRNKANKGHLLTKKKNRARKNKLKKPALVSAADRGLVLRCLPNG